MTDKPRRLYGSLDGFMVHLDAAWHEMKAGTWWLAEAGQHAADITCNRLDLI